MAELMKPNEPQILNPGNANPGNPEATAPKLFLIVDHTLVADPKVGLRFEVISGDLLLQAIQNHGLAHSEIEVFELGRQLINWIRPAEAAAVEPGGDCTPDRHVFPFATSNSAATVIPAGITCACGKTNSDGSEPIDRAVPYAPENNIDVADKVRKMREDADSRSVDTEVS